MTSMQQSKKEWDAICAGKPLVTVGGFTDDGLTEFYVEPCGLGQLNSDLDLEKLFNSLKPKISKRK